MSEEEPKPDWEAIEREYRAGQLSIREIAKGYHVSHPAIIKRARKWGWQRDLAAKVRETVRETLIREAVSTGQVTTPVTAKDDEIVRVAAARGVEIVRQHQRSLGRAHALVERFLGELEGVDKAKAGIAEVILSDKATNAKKRKAMLKAVDLPTRTQVVAALSGTLKNLIPLERRAFNLDEPGEGDEDTPIVKFRKEISGNAIRPAEGS